MDIIRKFELYQNRCKNAKRQEFANGKRDPMTNIICETKLYWILQWQKETRNRIRFGNPDRIEFAWQKETRTGQKM